MYETIDHGLESHFSFSVSHLKVKYLPLKIYLLSHGKIMIHMKKSFLQDTGILKILCDILQSYRNSYISYKIKVFHTGV